MNFFIGFFAAAIIAVTASWQVLDEIDIAKRAREIIIECESSLPRDKHCMLIAVESIGE